MSHVTNDKQREENKAIYSCSKRGVRQEWITTTCDFTGEPISEWREVSFNNCGPMEKLSVAQDKCIQCKKTFTY